MIDLSAVRPTGEEEIRMEAPGLTTLLQRWLSELNFRHTSYGRQYATFRVNAITDTSLAATVSGEPYDPDRHTIYTEIKAITYHQLLVVRTPEGHGSIFWITSSLRRAERDTRSLRF